MVNYSDINGAERGIRTPVGLRQLIYSQLQLATLVSRQIQKNSNTLLSFAQ